MSHLDDTPRRTFVNPIDISTRRPAVDVRFWAGPSTAPPVRRAVRGRRSVSVARMDRLRRVR